MTEKPVLIPKPNEIFFKETVINKSRFLAYCKNVDDVSQATDFLAQIKKKHYDATHNCYAYVVGDFVKFSDDGEPGGTAGKGLLVMLEEEGVQNAAILVARYFGGTKLGTGRLHRCFLSAGKESLSNAALGEETPYLCLHLDLSYSRYEEVKRLCKKKGYELGEEQYGLSVKANLYVDGKISFRGEELFLREEEILFRETIIRLKEVEHDPCQ